MTATSLGKRLETNEGAVSVVQTGFDSSLGPTAVF